MSESSIIVELEFRDTDTLKRIKTELSKIIKTGEIQEGLSGFEVQLYNFCHLEEIIVKGSKLYIFAINQDVAYLEKFITTPFKELLGESSFIFMEDDAQFIVSNINGQAVTLHSLGENSELDQQLEQIEWGYQSFTIVKDFYGNNIDKISSIFWNKYPDKGHLLFKLVCKTKDDAVYLIDRITELRKFNEPEPYKEFVSELSYRYYLKSTKNKKSIAGYKLYLQGEENQEIIEANLQSIPFEVFNNLKFLVSSGETVYFGSYIKDNSNFTGESGGDLESLFSLFWGFIPSPKLRISLDEDDESFYDEDDEFYDEDDEEKDTDFFYIIAAGCPVSFQTGKFDGIYDKWPVSR
jgi:hypothetical protein